MAIVQIYVNNNRFINTIIFMIILKGLKRYFS